MIYNRHIPKDVCQKILDVWGKNAQILMVLEEMSELQKEILKNINRGKDNIKEIAEETADVFIMLEQLVQSAPGEITLLPALPSAWKSGRLQGVRAHDGISVDLQWEAGRVTHWRLHAATPTRVTLHFNGSTQSVLAPCAGDSVATLPPQASVCKGQHVD